MLLKRLILERIAAGEVDLVFRRWKRPTVRAGGTLRTSIGVIAIDAVDAIALSEIRARDAHRAGFATRAALIRALSGRQGTLYRIAVRVAGDDPRIALRSARLTSDAELATVADRLDRLDNASRTGAWTRQYLHVIADNAGVRAEDLAASLSMEKKPFKSRVRRLKELGLTESLKIGYRLSPRGQSFLQRTSRA